MNVLEAMQQRISVRSYEDRAVEPDLLERLLSFSTDAGHLTGVSPRVALVSGAERTRCVLTYTVGSYGLVLTPPHLLVGVISQESDSARLNLGYVLEQVVLEATQLGLSTCWITGSYDAHSAGDAVGLEPGEIVAAVVALGYSGGSRGGRFHSRILRRLVGSRRKPLTDIAFSGQWGEPWSPDGADPTLISVLEHARLAPSAHNGQPWRFIVRPDGVALALVRSEPVDAGIVMAHVTLAAEALGWVGQWQVQLGDAALAQECALPARVTPVAIFG